MKRFLKILLLLISITGIITIFVILAGSLVIGGLFDPPINQKKAEKILLSDFEDFYAVIDYMKKSEFTDIDIESNDYVYGSKNHGTWYVYDNTLKNQNAKNKKITNKYVVDILDIFFNEKNCRNISKNGNTISFLLWSNLDDGRGIAYTPDGNPPTLQFLTKFEKLKKENWYYYEENFNEWRLNNRRQ